MKYDALIRFLHTFQSYKKLQKASLQVRCFTLEHFMTKILFRFWGDIAGRSCNTTIMVYTIGSEQENAGNNYRVWRKLNY